MKIEKKIVNIIFDAGRGGSCSVASREGACGEAFGALPTPTREGYDFEGWHLEGKPISAADILNSDTDVRLVAVWKKQIGKTKKRSVMRAQVVTCVVLAACILFLSVGIAIANSLVSIYYLTDRYYDAQGVAQSERYTIKRQNGVYKMFNRQGKLMETTENGYSLTNEDKTQTRYEVYVAETSGNQYVVNTATGEFETYAIVDYDANVGESLGGTVKAKRVMMFPRVGQDNTYSVEVTNQYGSYTLYRENVQSADNANKYTTSIVVSKNGENTTAAYNPELFASLCVSCGYTLTLQKLDFTAPGAPLKADGSIDYAEYGLENRYDENGNLTYTPTTYTITKAQYAANGSCSPAMERFDFDGDASNGKETERVVQYTVSVGDALVSDGGYYVKLSSHYANPNREGREAVYIVSNTIATTVLEPVESLVTPSVVYPMSVSTYAMVYNFRLGSLDQYTLNQTDINPTLTTAFDYVDMAKRENTMYSSVPYQLSQGLNLMNGYRFNSNNVSLVLGNLYNMEFVGCRVLRPTAEDLVTYKLDQNVFYLAFDYDPTIASGGTTDQAAWEKNELIISQETKDGTYFVYSQRYDMIVEVERYYLSFLEWDGSDWYDDSFFSVNIAHVKKMSISTGSGLYQFTLENQLSYAFYENGDGTGTVVDSSQGSIVKNADGSYTFTHKKTGATHKVKLMQLSPDTLWYESYTNASGKLATKLVYHDPGGVKVDFPQENTNNLQIYHTAANGALNHIDYTKSFTFINDKGETETETYTALDNFKHLYGHLLRLSTEGEVSKKDLGGVDVQTFIANNESDFMIRYDMEDKATLLNPEHYTTNAAEAANGNKQYGNNQKSVVLRFYRYNGLYALLTLEVLDNENATPDPTKAQGAFYVNVRVLEESLEYAQDFLNGTYIPDPIL